MKKNILLGIVATIVALTSSTARAGDVGIRVNIGLPLPRIVLPPLPRPIVVAPPVAYHPAPRFVPCAPPVVYHRCDYRCYHGRVQYGWGYRHDRHHAGRGYGHRGH